MQTLEIKAIERTETLEADTSVVMSVRDLNVSYGSKHVLRDVDMDLPERRITAFIGPSGCGKSTMLRVLNRMNDTIIGCSVEGTICLEGQDIYARDVSVSSLRRIVGMVFQQPNPFPVSIFENIALAIREHEPQLDRAEVERRVREALQHANLLEELEGELGKSALALSGGQQQRLCIARAIAIRPSVLMLDEPCASLDPISTAAIEELLLQLRRDYTIVIVTHNLAQARRISDKCAYFLMGELVEFGGTRQVFEHPAREETARYLSGVYG
jgi:phosphate transport system ATP-binding protein